MSSSVDPVTYKTSASIDIPFVNIQDVIARQTPTYDGWICPECKHHQGGINCSANVFIVCEGANTKNCMWFSRKRCSQCSENTKKLSEFQILEQ